MAKTIEERLQALRNRRTDTDILTEDLTKSFSSTAIPKTVKYIYESMVPIPENSTTNTYQLALRIQNQIIKNIPDVSILFDYQGSVPLNTHIKTHSDLDILVIHNGFFNVEAPLTIQPGTEYKGNPETDLLNLRERIFKVLESNFPSAKVDNSGAKAISIEGGSLKRKFDIIVCNKLETDNWRRKVGSNPKQFLGLYIYDKKKNSRFKDFPFTHMQRVNEKNDRTFRTDNYKRIIRLLKTLKMDADPIIDLTSFMITSTLYHMDDASLHYQHPETLKLLVSTSQFLHKVIHDKSFRSNLTSPVGSEKLFADKEEQKVQQFIILKRELDNTIVAAAKDIDFYETRFFGEFVDDLTIRNFYPVLEKANYFYDVL